MSIARRQQTRPQRGESRCDAPPAGPATATPLSHSGARSRTSTPDDASLQEHDCEMAWDAGELNRPWQLWSVNSTGWMEDGCRSDDEPGPEPPRFFSALEAEGWAAMREEEARQRSGAPETAGDCRRSATSAATQPSTGTAGGAMQTSSADTPRWLTEAEVSDPADDDASASEWSDCDELGEFESERLALGLWVGDGGQQPPSDGPFLPSPPSSPPSGAGVTPLARAPARTGKRPHALALAPVQAGGEVVLADRAQAHLAPLTTHSRLPEWDSEESRQAATRLRDRPTDFRREARRDEAMRWAGDAGLVGVHARPADVFVGQPGDDELRNLRTLRAASYRVAHESVDPDRLRTAIRHWRLFREELPSRQPFVPLSGPDSPGVFEADQYNSETLELFQSSIISRGSLQPGRLSEPIDTKTAAGYVSAIRAFISRDGGVQMRSERCNVRPRAIQRCVRRTRGPIASRRRRIGIRAIHLRSAEADGSFDRSSTWPKRRRWCAAVVGHQLVARGAELGRADGQALSRTRGLRWRNVEWHALGSLSRTHLVLTVHLCAAKDVEGGGQRFPLLIRRRAAGAGPLDEEDAMCAYDLLLAAWREDVEQLGETAALDRPIFRRSCADGDEHAFKTSTMLSIAREVAEAAGLDPSDVGGHSFRIGGATDFRDLYDNTSEGLAEARRVLMARGRWKSDIAFIYVRTSAVTALEASARVADVDTRDVEAMFSGWAQPAN